MSEPIQRIIVESALPTPSDEPNEDLKSLWAYAGGCCRVIRRYASNYLCPVSLR